MSKPKPEAGAVAEPVEVKEATVEPTETVPTTAKEPVGHADELFVYIGPNIHGVIQSGMVLDGVREAALASISLAVEKHPLVAALVVPARTLAEDRIKVRTPGNLLHVNYAKLVAGLKS